ncbi:MAG: hypothetical protein QOD92_23, partial [Acidimicrobiaceae bacterium]
MKVGRTIVLIAALSVAVTGCGGKS